MGKIVREALMQPVDSLHVLLANAARQSPVPGADGRRLDSRSRALGARTRGANHDVDFVLAQDLLHRADLWTSLN